MANPLESIRRQLGELTTRRQEHEEAGTGESAPPREFWQAPEFRRFIQTGRQEQQPQPGARAPEPPKETPKSPETLLMEATKGINLGRTPERIMDQYDLDPKGPRYRPGGDHPMDEVLGRLDSLSGKELEEQYGVPDEPGNRELFKHYRAEQYTAQAMKQQFVKSEEERAEANRQRQRTFDRQDEISKELAALQIQSITDEQALQRIKTLQEEHEENQKYLETTPYRVEGMGGTALPITPREETGLIGAWQSMNAAFRNFNQTLSNTTWYPAVAAWARALPEFLVYGVKVGTSGSLSDAYRIAFGDLQYGPEARTGAYMWQRMSQEEKNDALAGSKADYWQLIQKHEQRKDMTLGERFRLFGVTFLSDASRNMYEATKHYDRFRQKFWDEVNADKAHLWEQYGIDKDQSKLFGQSFIGNPINVDVDSLTDADVQMMGWASKDQLRQAQVIYAEIEQEKTGNYTRALEIMDEVNTNSIELYQQDPTGQLVRDMTEEARSLMLIAIKAQNDMANMNPEYTDHAFRYTWSMAPDSDERKELALQAIADATLQKGGWLEKWEVHDITERFSDPASELMGEAFFDPTNYIPGAVFGLLLKPLKHIFKVPGIVLKGPFKGAAKLIDDAARAAKGTKYLDELMGFAYEGFGHADDFVSPIQPLRNWGATMLEQSTRTMATWVAGDVLSVSGKMMRSLGSTKQVRAAFAAIVYGRMDELAKLNKVGLSLGDRVRLLGSKGVLRTLGITDPADFIKIFDGAVDEVYNSQLSKLIDEAMEGKRGVDAFDADEAARILEEWTTARREAIRSGQPIEPGHPLLSAEELGHLRQQAQRYVDDFRNVNQALGNAVEDAFLKTKSLWKDGPQEGTFTKWWMELVQKNPDRAKLLGKIPQKHLESMYRGANWLRMNWVKAILPARPGFTVINFLDSSLRMILSGGSLMDDMATLVDMTPFIPHDVPGGFASVTTETGWNLNSRIAEGWWPKLGFLDIFLDGAKGSKNAWEAWVNGWMAINSAMETSLRIRVYAPAFVKEFRMVEDLIELRVKSLGLTDDLAQETKDLFMAARYASKNNPAKLKALVSQMADLKAGKTPFGLYFPEGWFDELSEAVGPENARRIASTIMDDLLLLVEADELGEAAVGNVFAKIENTIRERADEVNRAMEQNVAAEATSYSDPNHVSATAATSPEEAQAANDAIVERRRAEAWLRHREQKIAEFDNEIDHLRRGRNQLQEELDHINNRLGPEDSQLKLSFSEEEDDVLRARRAEIQNQLDEINTNLTAKRAEKDAFVERGWGAPTIEEVDELPHGALATTTPEGQIRIKRNITVDEFFEHIQGGGGSEASKQKARVLRRLESRGITIDTLREELDTPEKIRDFLIAHEESHIRHGDRSKYWENGADLTTPDKIEIEVRAFEDALEEVRAPDDVRGPQPMDADAPRDEFGRVEETDVSDPVADAVRSDEAAVADDRADYREFAGEDTMDTWERARASAEAHNATRAKWFEAKDDLIVARQNAKINLKLALDSGDTESVKMLTEQMDLIDGTVQYIDKVHATIITTGESGLYRGFLRNSYPNPYQGNRAERWALVDSMRKTYYDNARAVMEELYELAGTEDGMKELVRRLNENEAPSVADLVMASRDVNGEVATHGFEFRIEEGRLTGIRLSDDARLSPQYWDGSFADEFMSGSNWVEDPDVLRDFQRTFFGDGVGSRFEEVLNDPIAGPFIPEDVEIEVTVPSAEERASQQASRDHAEQVVDETWVILQETQGGLRFPKEVNSLGEYRSYLDELRDAALNRGDIFAADVIQNYREYITSQYNWIAQGQHGARPTFNLPPLDNYMPGTATAMRQIVMSETELRATGESMSALRGHVLGGLNDGSIFMTKLAEDQARALTALGDEYADLMIQGIDAANYGGEFLGQTFNGAVNFTNERMLDYTNYNNIEGFIKGYIIPFYMFPARSLPMWTKLMVESPWLATAYMKYMQHSERVAIEHGLINRYGDPLPSTRGRLPIPGTDIWFNATGPLSFRFALPMNYMWPDYEEREDVSPVTAAARYIWEAGRMFGITPFPYIQEMAYATNILDVNDTPRWSIIPQLDLILPPNWRRHLRQSLYKLHPWVADFMLPEVSWKDYLIEKAVLTKATEDIANGKNPEASALLAEQAIAYKEQDTRVVVKLLADRREEIIKERERRGDDFYGEDTMLWINEQLEILKDRDNPQAREYWLQTRSEVENSEYYLRGFGYFTGQYGRIHTDADAELILLKNDIMALQDGLNNEVVAAIFDLPTRAKERWDHYVDRAYSDPQGLISNLRDQIGWVTTPEGDAVRDPTARNEILLMQIQEDQQTRAYFKALDSLRYERDISLREAPVGDKQTRKAIYADYMARRGMLEMEDMYAEAFKTWYVGYKPKVLVYEDMVNLFFRIVQEDLPFYDKSKHTSYKEFEKEYEEYLAPENLAMMVSASGALWKQFSNIEWLHPELNQPKDIIGRLLEIATPEGFREWQKDNDTVDDAIMWAYQEHYLSGLFDAVDGKKNEDYELASRNYLRQFGESKRPDDLQMMQWITAEYGDRFDPVDIMEALKGRDFWDLDYRMLQDAMAEDGEEEALLDNRRSDILGAIPPGYRNTEFKDKFIELGGDESFIESYMWDAGDEIEITDLDYYSQQLGIAERAAGVLGFSLQPTDQELHERSTARRAQEAKAEWLDGETYPGFSAELGEYWNLDESGRKAYRQSNPQFAQAYRNYGSLIEEYAALNPEWAKYYQKDKADTIRSYTGVGYGGGGYSGSYGGSGQFGGEYSVRDRPIQPFIPAGKRTSMDTRRLAFSVGMAGPVGNIWFPDKIIKYTGKELPKRVNEAIAKGTGLDAVDEQFINNVKSKHPETEEFLSEVQNTVRRYASGGYVHQGH